MRSTARPSQCGPGGCRSGPSGHIVARHQDRSGVAAAPIEEAPSNWRSRASSMDALCPSSFTSLRPGPATPGAKREPARRPTSVMPAVWQISRSLVAKLHQRSRSGLPSERSSRRGSGAPGKIVEKTTVVRPGPRWRKRTRRPSGEMSICWTLSRTPNSTAGSTAAARAAPRGRRLARAAASGGPPQKRRLRQQSIKRKIVPQFEAIS